MVPHRLLDAVVTVGAHRGDAAQTHRPDTNAAEEVQRLQLALWYGGAAGQRARPAHDGGSGRRERLQARRLRERHSGRWRGVGGRRRGGGADERDSRTKRTGSRRTAARTLAWRQLVRVRRHKRDRRGYANSSAGGSRSRRRLGKFALRRLQHSPQLTLTCSAMPKSFVKRAPSAVAASALPAARRSARVRGELGRRALRPASSTVTPSSAACAAFTSRVRGPKLQTCASFCQRALRAGITAHAASHTGSHPSACRVTVQPLENTTTARFQKRKRRRSASGKPC